jgi:hypothetical protein
MAEPLAGSSSQHPLLRGVIRATNLLLAILISLFFLMIVIGGGLAMIRVVNQFRVTKVHDEFVALVLLLVVLLMFAWLLLILFQFCVKSAPAAFGQLFRIDPNAVSNFAFLFAASAAHDLYYLLPTKVPAFLRVSTLTETLLDRTILSYLVFWILWRAIKTLLLRILELNMAEAPPNSPSSRDSIDPDAPEFPRKSPLVQL